MDIYEISDNISEMVEKDTATNNSQRILLTEYIDNWTLGNNYAVSSA